MTRTLSILFAVSLAIAPAAALAQSGADDGKHMTRTPNTLTEAEKAAGWKLLFDGKTTKGWRGYKKETAPEGWQVVDGALVRTGKGGDLMTEDQYGSFELAWDWKVAKNGNSGVFYHVVEAPEAETTYASGPEYQILDNAGHPDAKNGGDRLAGANYALHAPTKDTSRPAGEWNTSRIVVRGNHVEHWLNGEKVVEFEENSEDWKARVAKSKFAKMPLYAKADRGHVALQDHGDEVAFRNIRMRELNPNSSSQ